MATQLGFYINQSGCSGCHACFMACKDKNDLDDERAFRKIHETRSGKFTNDHDGLTNNVTAFWSSIACNHCEVPLCVVKCPTGAMQKNSKDGTVYADLETCIGAKFCILNCPYEAPQFNEQTMKISKCDLCADLRANGEDPACVAACPLGNIEYGPIDELRKKYGEVAQTFGLPDASITKPNLVITPHKGAS